MNEYLLKEIPKKAISVRQPWATLIVSGILTRIEDQSPEWEKKDIENRTRKTNFRGQIFIHASKTFDRMAYRKLCKIFPERVVKIFYFVYGSNFAEVRGGIVGVTNIVDCVETSESVWFEKSGFGYVLKDSFPLPFHLTKGALSLFEPKISDEYLNEISRLWKKPFTFEPQPEFEITGIGKIG